MISNAFAVLNDLNIKTGISDSALESVLRMFEGHLDNQYYTRTDHGTIEVSHGRYSVQFIESDVGYYMTVIDTVEKTWRKVFVALFRGDWTIDQNFFKKPENLQYMMAFNITSNQYVESMCNDDEKNKSE